ncbi:MAG TPA: hypothetical protein VJP78_09285, partial [Thermoleophilia bacterium]|nr:hypothetical protein [Thermoleophilia bacterium]
IKGPGGPGQSEGKGAIEQSNNRPHFPVAQCSIVHWSNALAIKKAREIRAFLIAWWAVLGSNQ